MANVYAEARQGRLDWHAGARAASILQVLSRMIEGSEFEERLAAVEAALAARGNKLNGASKFALKGDRHARP